MTFTIHTLREGELISSPGFYDIPIEVHHSQCCIGPSVTSGILRKMELQTPADVFAYHALNTNSVPTADAPRRYVQEDTDALRLGRAMASFVQGGMEEVAKHYLVLPEDKPRKPTEAQIVAYDAGKGTEAGIKSVEFWRAIETDPRTPLTDAEITMIAEMGEALVADPAVSVLMGGIPEVSMVYQDEATGLWVLARPDTVSFDGLSSDFKKMSAQGGPFTHRLVDRRISQHGYGMQGALACEAFERLTGEWPEFWIIAQSDKPPYHVIPRQITEEDLRMDQFRNRRALRRFAECLASGRWPGPAEDIAAYQRPDWERQMILDQMQTEGTAP